MLSTFYSTNFTTYYTDDDPYPALPHLLSIDIPEPQPSEILCVSSTAQADAVCAEFERLAADPSLPIEDKLVGCDTEFEGWDSSSSMVGNGRVICLSLYSGVGLNVDGGTYKYVWVDVDGESGGEC